MNLSIIAVGRMGDEPEAALFRRYAQRIRPSLILTEVEDTKKLLASLPRGAFVIALDEGGQAPNSVTFAQLLERWLGSGRPVCFLIGGADGLDAATLKRADAVLSLGPLTWPHLLARVMLAEQIYRARAIAAGHPYHRAGRPD
ncbi:MAG: 23S rRNA (pseudouridine(1915)-N(3))-methyltransferase RlmH [Acetobacteraceae bacterium]|nr:23S rRNA (pseudouridine(1915)-N(3))-methyltransferase RlmH [Acetobacteraceae bacterium]